MKTLTVTEARKNLSKWLRLAKKGEEIGIVDGADIIALRPVKITSVDYVESEYGLKAEEADRVFAQMAAEAQADYRAGRLVDLDTALKNAKPHAKAAGRRRPRKAQH